MKFNIRKAIFAAAIALMFVFSSFGADAVKAAAESAGSTQQRYKIIVNVDPNVADIDVRSSSLADQMVWVNAYGKNGYQVTQIHYSGGGKSGTIRSWRGFFYMPEGDVTITAVDVTNMYRVSSSAGDHVTVNISGTGKGQAPSEFATYGDSISVTATPDWGYNITKFEVQNADDGTVIETFSGSSGTFSMPGNPVVVVAEAEPQLYVIDCFSSPAEGTSMTIVRGAKADGAIPGKNIIIDPWISPGYYLVSIVAKTADGKVIASTTTDETLLFTMPAARVVVIVTCSTTPPDPTKPTTPITPTEPTTPTTPTEPTTPTTPTEPTTPTTPTEPITPTTPTAPAVPTTPTKPTTPAFTYQKGDVNLDGKVNVIDATLILKHSVQLITLNSEQLDRADINGDWRANAADATLILKMALGLA